MSPWKSGLAALIVVAGLSSSADAQYFPGYSGVGYGTGYGTGYGYGYPGRIGNYAAPGVAPYYGGYGIRPPASYYGSFPNPYGGRVSNNLGGVANIIQQQTGRPGSYRYRGR